MVHPKQTEPVPTSAQLLGFGIAAMVIIAIPGPSVMFVIGRALTYGRRVALLSVLGNSLGLLVVMTLVSLGLGALVAKSMVVFTAVKLAGAAYMIWLGIQAFRHRRAIHVDTSAPRAALPGTSRCGKASWSASPTRRRS